MKKDGFRIDFFALVLDFFTFGIYSGYNNIKRIENQGYYSNGVEVPSNYQYILHQKK